MHHLNRQILSGWKYMHLTVPAMHPILESPRLFGICAMVGSASGRAPGDGASGRRVHRGERWRTRRSPAEADKTKREERGIFVYCGDVANRAIQLAGVEFQMFRERSEIKHTFDFEKMSDVKPVQELEREARLLLEHDSGRSDTGNGDPFGARLVSR